MEIMNILMWVADFDDFLHQELFITLNTKTIETLVTYIQYTLLYFQSSRSSDNLVYFYFDDI